MSVFRGDIYSESLAMTTGLTIIFPDVSNDVTKEIYTDPKVLYLLHGLSANSGEWTRFSKIEYYAKKYNFIVIMPEVNRSFYTDMYFGPKYFTYIADELPVICRTWFNIPEQREQTFIAGESMGGYGAVKTGMSRIKNFAGIASLSGVLDIRSFIEDVKSSTFTEVNPIELTALFGPAGTCSDTDDAILLASKAAKLVNRPRLIQICGTEDFLYSQNIVFKNTLEKIGYGHTYMEWPGEHAWPFWDDAIQRVLQFFCGLDLKTTPLY